MRLIRIRKRSFAIIFFISMTLLNLHGIDSVPSNLIYQFSDFNDFELKSNQSDFINSTNSGESVSFSYNGNGSEIQHEYYFYNLSSSFSDFDIEVIVDYNYTGDQFGRFSFNLKSYFDEQLRELETLDGTALGQVTVYDAWIYSGGVFSVIGWPNDTKSNYQTDYGETGHFGTVKFRLQRVDFLMTLTVEQNEAIKIQHEWSSDVSRPLNYISFGGFFYNTETYPHSNGFDITIRSIEAELTYYDNSLPSFIFSGFSFISVLLSLGIFVLLGVTQKKRKS